MHKLYLFLVLLRWDRKLYLFLCFKILLGKDTQFIPGIYFFDRFLNFIFQHAVKLINHLNFALNYDT
jgi:hypothetical protein